MAQAVKDKRKFRIPFVRVDRVRPQITDAKLALNDSWGLFADPGELESFD
jgi:hypothetical protein